MARIFDRDRIDMLLDEILRLQAEVSRLSRLLDEQYDREKGHRTRPTFNMTDKRQAG